MSDNMGLEHVPRQYPLVPTSTRQYPLSHIGVDNDKITNLSVGPHQYPLKFTTSATLNHKPGPQAFYMKDND